MSKQTRYASLIESILNVAISLVVGTLSQIVVFPWFGINISLSANAIICLILSLIATVRNFVVRRLFEHFRVQGILP